MYKLYKYYKSRQWSSTHWSKEVGVVCHRPRPLVGRTVLDYPQGKPLVMNHPDLVLFQALSL